MILSQHLNLFGSEYNDESGVPVHTQDAINQYMLNGWQPGGFLTAVLTNNLFRVVQCADTVNSQKIPQITKWLIHNVPACAIGSHEAIDKWVGDADGRRSAYTDKLMKEKMWEKLND